jgi:hypothetical protein
MVALAKFVHFLKMRYPHFPVLFCCYSHRRTRNRRGRNPRTGEVFTAIAARVSFVWPRWRIVERSRIA